MRLLGLDPGLRHTGWGVIELEGSHLRHVADGVCHSRSEEGVALRLSDLFRQLTAIIDRYAPAEAAVEESFVNKNPASTLKLGLARGVALLAPAERGLPVFEYAANLIKKSVVGAGHAEKRQVAMMIHRLLPGATLAAPDAADALAVALCHAHHRQTQRKWSLPLSPEGRGEGEGAAPHSDARQKLRGAAPSPRPCPRRGEGDLRRDAQRMPLPIETERARELRREGTDVERRLWRHLSNRQLEQAKFRRQEPILGFIADFVCHEKRLIVELDGGQHAEQTEADARRTRLLEQAGFRVLRFWNTDIIDNLEGVLETIRHTLLETAVP